jgi:L-threonylcarbamoyladenylate synthase
VKEKTVKMVIKSLKEGGVGVLPTDTLYGLVGRAEDKKAVAKIKKLKQRSAGKPFIILISSLKDLEKFRVKLNKDEKKILEKFWPGPVSVALSPKLSFRWPKNKILVEIIKKTGPLVAPSANPEGLTPASTITEAKKYFPVKSQGSHGASEEIDFIISAGKRLSGQPSTLISLKNGQVEIIRQGRARLSPLTLERLFKGSAAKK